MVDPSVFDELIAFMNKNSIPRVHFEEIQLISKIAEGGQGKIMKAKFKSNDGEYNVAVKALENIDLKSFYREIFILSQLDQRFFPKFYGLVVEKDNISIVMEFIEGSNLNLLKIEEVSDQNKLKIIKNLSEALCLVHDFGFIHRDLKPDNVMVDKNFNIYLIDFGISLIIVNEEAQTVVKGTIPYLSPESFDMEEKDGFLVSMISQMTDVWAFGCIVSYIYSGVIPWTNKYDYSESKIENALMNKHEFPIPKNIVDEKILEILKASLKILPKERRTMKEIYEYLNEIFNDD